MSSYQNNWEPWDQDTYQTGNTRPPKKRGGIFAVLLVLVIFLCGTLSLLGFSTIRVFRDSVTSPDERDIPFSVGDSQSSLSTTPTSAPVSDSGWLEIHASPQGAENIPQAGGLSLQEIYTKTIDSVVSITSTHHNGASTGTGVLVTDSGYLVTNHHVVAGAQSILVQLNDGRRFDAILIGSDATSDLAVLQIHGENLIPAQLGDSNMLRVGDTVVAIGDPLGAQLHGTMTDGIVSAINRDISVGGRVMTLIQTNAALNSGNSGGPLINCYGQVIGINTMKIGDSMSTAGVEGLGFAIPTTTVKEIVNQLLSQGYVSGRPSLGFSGEMLSSFYQMYYHMPLGLYISQIDPDSSAVKAGIQTGDLLLQIGTVRVTSQQVLSEALYAYNAGDPAELVIYRNGRQYTVTITLEEAQPSGG